MGEGDGEGQGGRGEREGGRGIRGSLGTEIKKGDVGQESGGEQVHVRI